MPVRLLRTVVGWVLLLVWLPATSLCLVERAGWLANDDCCPSSAPKSSPGKQSNDTTCCTLASASYKADDYSRLHIAAPLFIGVLIFEAFAAEAEPGDTVLKADDLSPPVLLKTWQFTSRTALPPRAPSLAS